MTQGKRIELLHFENARALVSAFPDLLSRGYSYDLTDLNSGCWYTGGGVIAMFAPDADQSKEGQEQQ